MLHRLPYRQGDGPAGQPGDGARSPPPGGGGGPFGGGAAGGAVRRRGRVFELGMIAAYKLRSGDLLSDVDKFPRMLAKGKIGLLPKRSGDAKRLKEIFRRVEEEDK